MTEVYYPGLKRIHSEWDRLYEQKGKVPEVPSVGGEDEARDKAVFENPAKSAFGSYEPNKYKYGYENGRLYRESK
jgi:hypothetical protein